MGSGLPKWVGEAMRVTEESLKRREKITDRFFEWCERHSNRYIPYRRCLAKDEVEHPGNVTCNFCFVLRGLKALKEARRNLL